MLALDAAAHQPEMDKVGVLGCVVASASKDNTVRLWDCTSGRCLAVGEGHLAAVSAVAFTRRCACVLLPFTVNTHCNIASHCRLVALIPASDNAQTDVLACLPAYCGPSSVMPGEIVLNASSHQLQCSLKLLSTRHAQLWLPARSAMNCLAANLSAVVVTHTITYIYLLLCGLPCIEKRILAEPICLLTFMVECRSNKFLISAGADKLLKVWDAASALAASPTNGAPVAKLKSVAATAAHDKDINAVAVPPNDSLLCTASQDRTAKVLPPSVHSATAEVARYKRVSFNHNLHESHGAHLYQQCQRVLKQHVL